MRRFALWLSSLIAVLAFSGCVSVNTSVEKVSDISRYRHYFVQKNSNDDHGIAAMIAIALQGQGLDAVYGPLTMCPDTAEIIVTYEDRWTWDFKNHMISLRIIVHTAAENKTLAIGSYYAATAVGADSNEVVKKLVQKVMTSPPNVTP